MAAGPVVRSLSVPSALSRLLLALALVGLLGGCASTAGPQHDPWEPWNRSVQTFNDRVDETVLRPVAQTYADVVPSMARQGVSNFFGNLGDIWSTANHLMQGKLDTGLEQGMRVAVNTVFGIFGLLDVATEAGLQRQVEDFGQTLGYWGMPPGPYVVLPLLGPSSVRDTFGVAADYSLNPAPAPSDTRERNALIAVRVVDLRSQFLGADRLLEDAALDRYAFIREAYLQRRRNLVYDGNPPDDDDSEDWYEDWEDEENERNASDPPSQDAPATQGSTESPSPATPAAR